MDKVLMSFQCDKDFKENLKKEAKKRGVTVSAYIKSALYDKMNKEQES